MRDGWAVCDAASGVAAAIERGVLPLTEIGARDYNLAVLAAHSERTERAERRRQMDAMTKAFNGPSRRNR